MSKGKANFVELISPAGIAVFPKLITPDEYKGKSHYKTGLKLSPSDEGVQEFLDKITEVCQNAFDAYQAKVKKEGNPKQKKAAKSLELFVPFEEELDEEGDETGFVILNVKSLAKGTTQKGKPWERTTPIYDAANQLIEGAARDSMKLWGGSEIKVGFRLFPFDAVAGRSGCSAQLQATQVIQLSVDGNAPKTGGFGAVEGGYTAEMQATPDSSDDGLDEDDF